MTAIVPHGSVLPARIGVQKIENELGAGIEIGFGVVGYKGKVWSTRYRGVVTPLLRADGDGARGSIEVVIVRSAWAKSKTYFTKYVEGSTEGPTCFSNNGITPDPRSPAKQAEVCAKCPRNVWGSRTTDSGSKGKECSDAKRIAVVPYPDVTNEALGGPMLLRVPAASLAALVDYGERIGRFGYHPHEVITRIKFDPNQPYPKFIFEEIGAVPDTERAVLAALYEDPRVLRILSEEGDDHSASAEPVRPSPLAFAPAPVTTVVTPPVAVKPAPVTTVVTPPAAVKPAEVALTSNFDAELDDMLGKLMPAQ